MRARALMARAFHAASPLPLPPKKSTPAFQWLLKRAAKTDHDKAAQAAAQQDDEEEFLPAAPPAADALGRLRAAVAAVVGRRLRRRRGRLGACVTGTIYGRRRGHVRLALQTDPRAPPVLLVELAASTAALVREMSSGLVRLAFECDRAAAASGGGGGGGARRPLVEEPAWRAYCNGRKCGFAARRECAAEDWRVLGAVEAVSVGAGVLPAAAGDIGGGGGGGEGDLLYMRARFERVVGSKDSEAFYMVNPDGHGGPELSIYLLRV